jgi:HEAT repeat protein
MLENEILDIVADPADDGTHLNEIVNQFRRGRDAGDLIDVLDSNDPQVVSIAAYILGELPFRLYNGDRFISRLRKLVDHPNAAVRLHAFGAIFPALDPKEADTQALLQKLRNDPNEGVRMRARAATARLSST